jgi:hypothetical protein
MGFIFARLKLTGMKSNYFSVSNFNFTVHCLKGGFPLKNNEYFLLIHVGMQTAGKPLSRGETVVID